MLGPSSLSCTLGFGLSGTSGRIAPDRGVDAPDSEYVIVKCLDRPRSANVHFRRFVADRFRLEEVWNVHYSSFSPKPIVPVGSRCHLLPGEHGNAI